MTPATHQITHQLDMFDLLTLQEPVVAPLGFTIDAYSPEKLNKAADRWRIEHGTMGLWGKSHMWHCTGYDPTEWQVPGAPVRTLRQPMGIRHVPERSPFGGYDAGTLTH